ncbi:14439_t:CDS:1, partial [Funneliformis caledonium]
VLAIKYSIARSKLIIDITSFILLNYNPINQIQNLEDPWLYKTSLNALQIEELFNIIPKMQTLIN